MTACGLLLAFPSTTAAHDIPKSVTVLAFIRPSGDHLRLIVRVPLEAMRDVNFPLRGPGYLEIARLEPLLPDAARLWIANAVQLYEGGTRLTRDSIIATRVSLQSDRSFETYERAVAHFAEPRLPESSDLAWQQAMFDVMIDYPITSDQSLFSIDPALARLGVRTSTVLRFLPPGRSERAFQYNGDPGLVRLDPRWYQAARRFVALGFAHILDGLDHLLFIFCLIIPFRRIRPLVAIITAFTIAHSITLFASALGLAPDALWFPPLIEVLIALSIVYMALENIVGPKLQRRALIAFGFGLVHGFGFSFALRESLQFAGSHLLTSLFAFNVGVELGQLFVLALALPALALLFKYGVAERMGTIILSAFVAHTAWHWMLDRFSTLRQYRFTLPALDLATLAAGMRGLMLLLIVGGAGWGVVELRRRLAGPASDPAVPPILPPGRELMRDRRPAPEMRWTTGLLVCMLVAYTNLGAQTPKGTTKHPAVIPAAPKTSPAMVKANANLASTLTGVYTDEQAGRGRNFYLGTCKACHAPESHTGPTFAKWWKGRKLSDLFTFISTQMPKNDPGSLDPGDIADVMAYLMKLNAQPPGKDELYPDADSLKKFRIDVKQAGTSTAKGKKP